MKNLILITMMTLLSTSAHTFSRWDEFNKPGQFSNDYEKNLETLPVTGQLTVIPWSGDYWPTEKGGITFRWNKYTSQEHEKYGYSLLNMDDLSGVDLSKLSPAEKWDIYLGDKDWSLTRFERKRTDIMRTVPGSSTFDQDFDIPYWEGLCHAWAPATLAFEEPGAISVKGALGSEVEFGSSDMKALLTMFLHLNPGESKFLGSRCNLDKKDLKEKLEKGEITVEDYALKMAELIGPSCEGVNAGAFHIVLTNQIKRDEGFVIDITRDMEVWNQPVVAFDSKMGNPQNGATPGAAEGTVQEIFVKTTMYYIAEISQSWGPGFNQDSIATKNYEYVLELDKDANILGGRWLSSDRPDFMWTQSRAKFKKYFAPLEDLYKKSTKHLNSLTWIRTVNKVMGLKEKLKKARTALKFRHLIGQNVRINKFVNAIKSKRRLRKLKNYSKKLEVVAKFKNMTKIQAQLGKSFVEAVERGDNTEIISLIIEGADVNAKKFNLPKGYLLNKVIKKGNRSIVLAFINAGASLETGLVRSIEVGAYDISELFLKHGAGLVYKNENGENALMLAATMGYSSIVGKILSKSNLVNEINKHGRNALILAITGMGTAPGPERVEIVKMLLKKNIDLSTRDNFNQSAIDYAASFRRSPKNSHKKIKKLIKKAKKRARRRGLALLL
ncbi:MAG: hypothetical protein DRQ88_05470 [Epsilonproteobacteria bacterium]|nr:MAG: hypothetical protein DRQ89_08485 [Campylobacterota bacterium]RLA66765.1 MAG: hypothetical protein DRQ88_05470 [Campylobacterota bacterium]